MSQQLPLFEDYVTPETEGIKYAGSKLKLLPYIQQLVNEVNPHTILDGFSGTTRVAQALAQLGYQVIANDIAVWSKVFGTCYLLNRRSKSYYKDLIDYLNSLPGRDGWFTENYGGLPNGGISKQPDGLKKPWQIHNTRKLDAIREEIDRAELDEIERSVTLASLILALDSVDNTLGHYAAYLKEWSARSFDTMVLKVPELFASKGNHSVLNDDIFDILDETKVDLAYFDPPYGSNNEKMPPSRVRYAAYYHIWTTICLNDRPKLFGKAKRRADTSDRVAASVFEEYRRNKETGRFIAVEAIERLLKKARAKFIILSYSSGGRATAQSLDQAISKYGKIRKVVKVDYKKNVMAGMTWTNEWVRDAEKPHKEFLFLIEK
ncbi:MAG: DNA methyltransferase [Anaerolineaceae bacterium 4572_32.2]|nr:MAG: DNA methyltransferase [Anaerolineaceae bacterium 4572_32.2]